MAQPSTELNTFRRRVTSYLDELDNLSGVLAPVEGAGSTDPDRKAFFQAWLSAQADYDITGDELLSAVVKLRELEAWLGDNLPTLAKMRI